MSLEHIRSECSEVAALLQPHVDGELADAEQQRVAEHLDGCDACRAAVSEQMWVRATLRSVERQPAPQALRARVLLGLDEVDSEAEAEAAASAPPPSLGARLRARTSDLMRGGMVMLPAAAVAAGLFLVARGGLQPVQTMPASGLSTAMTRATVSKDAPKTAPAPVAALPGLSAIQPQVAFPIQVASPSGKERVQLVGARLDPTAGNAQQLGARLRYRVFEGAAGREHHIIDRQRPVGGPSPTGTPVTFKGQQYTVSRADSGAPTVQFEHGGVAHMLTLEGGPRSQTAETVHVESPDFSVLLDVADRVARSSSR